MWYHAAMILSACAPVDTSRDGTEKVLQVVSSRFPNKAARSVSGTMGWVFLIALKANMDIALHDAPGHSVQRRLEELEQHILVLGQEPCGPGEPSISDSEAVMTVMMNMRPKMMVVNIMRLRVPAWQRGML